MLTAGTVEQILEGGLGAGVRPSVKGVCKGPMQEPASGALGIRRPAWLTQVTGSHMLINMSAQDPVRKYWVLIFHQPSL